MSFEQISDTDSTTVGAGGYTAGSGSLLVVASGGANSRFPTSPVFRIRIKDQNSPFATKARLKVTAIPDSTHLTVTTDGLDANCAAGDVVENILSTNGLRALMSQHHQVGTFANLPATTVGLGDGDFYDQTDGPYSWRFNGSVWVPLIPGVGAVTLPLSSGWTWDNQGAGSTDFTNGYMYLLAPRIGSTASRVFYRTAPATPYTVTALMRADITGAGFASSTGSTTGFGLAFRDSTGKLVTYYVYWDGSNWRIVTDKWTTTVSFSAGYSNYAASPAATWAVGGRIHIWLRIADNGTNLIFSWSLDGQHWNQLDSRTRTDFLASGPTQYGVFTLPNGDAVDLNLLSLVES